MPWVRGLAGALERTAPGGAGPLSAAAGRLPPGFAGAGLLRSSGLIRRAGTSLSPASRAEREARGAGGARRRMIEAEWGEAENTEQMLMLEKGEVRGRT